MPVWLVLMAYILLSSCTSWRAEYLDQAIGTATQDEVTMKLGPPMGERILSRGESVWVYRYSGAAVGEQGGSTWCREYVLKFDVQGILRHWNRQRC